MKNSATTKNSSKYTEDWLPIKSIANGAIILDKFLNIGMTTNFGTVIA